MQVSSVQNSLKFPVESKTLGEIYFQGSKYCKIHRQTIELESLFIINLFYRTAPGFPISYFVKTSPKYIFFSNICGICGIVFRVVFTCSLKWDTIIVHKVYLCNIRSLRDRLAFTTIACLEKINVKLFKKYFG